MDTEATWIHGQEVKGWPGIHSKKTERSDLIPVVLEVYQKQCKNGSIDSNLNNIKSIPYNTISIFRSLDGFVVLS